jgi:outer membrane lipoprotein-sorting protein
MKYFILVMAAAMLLSGCEQASEKQIAARFSDIGQYRVDVAGETCKKGVVYYVTFYDRSIAMAPAFNPDSTVRTCSE